MGRFRPVRESKEVALMRDDFEAYDDDEDDVDFSDDDFEDIGDDEGIDEDDE